jgi:hypothetical protein
VAHGPLRWFGDHEQRNRPAVVTAEWLERQGMILDAAVCEDFPVANRSLTPGWQLSTKPCFGGAPVEVSELSSRVLNVVRTLTEQAVRHSATTRHHVVFVS